MNDWLNTSWKEWAEDLFNSDSYRKEATKSKINR